MRVSRNVIWNVMATMLPLLVGVAVIPRINAQLGVERYGLLSVIWILIGYFSVFDFGLGRTLTKVVADRMGTPLEREIPEMVSTVVGVVALLGLALGVVVGASAPWVVRSLLHVPRTEAGEAIAAMRWLALALPFVLVATAWIGLLEGLQKFAMLSVVRVPAGILMFLAPLAVLPLSHRLDTVAAALTAVRIGQACVLMRMAWHSVPQIRRHLLGIKRSLLRPLLTFGGWLTVSNVVGPLMVYADRFLITATLGPAAVAYYTVPYDVLTRLLVLPTAIQGVLFPTFAFMTRQDSSGAARVFARASEINFAVFAPVMVLVQLLGGDLLRVWMGSSFEEHSAAVAEILVFGVLLNAMTRTAFVFVQSSGRANWSATVHLAELPLYVAALWWLLPRYGIRGAALAWTTRVVIDTVIFYLLSARLERSLRRVAWRDLLGIVAACAIAVLVSLVLRSLVTRLVFVAAFAVACGVSLLVRLKSSLLSLGGRAASVS